MMRKILIPTDFFENSLNSIKYATELFKHGLTKIYLLYDYYDEVFEDLKQQIAKRAIDMLENLKKQIVHFYPNPKHTIHSKAEFATLKTFYLI